MSECRTPAPAATACDEDGVGRGAQLYVDASVTTTLKRLAGAGCSAPVHKGDELGLVCPSDGYWIAARVLTRLDSALKATDVWLEPIPSPMPLTFGQD